MGIVRYAAVWTTRMVCRSRVSLSMLIPGAANVKVRFKNGLPSIPNTYRRCSSRSRSILAAALTPVSAQSKGHSFHLLLEVSMASVLVIKSFIVSLIIHDAVNL